jgi:hypothetical protein
MLNIKIQFDALRRLVIFIAVRFLHRSHLPDPFKNPPYGVVWGVCPLHHTISQSGPLGAVVVAASAHEKGRGVE